MIFNQSLKKATLAQCKLQDIKRFRISKKTTASREAPDIPAMKTAQILALPFLNE
jgi:hypothetical protein